MIYYDAPKTLELTAELLLKLDTRIRANTVKRSSKRNQMGQFRSPTNQPRPAPAPVPPTPTSANASHTPGVLAPVDLSAFVPRHRAQAHSPPTNEKRTRRFQAGLCMYCGQASHFARQCPLSRCKATPYPAMRGRVTVVTPLVSLTKELEEPAGNA